MSRETTEVEFREEHRFRASMCPGDGDSNDVRSWHDWRLWKRTQRYVPVNSTREYESRGWETWPLVGHDEQWYCTRCRKIEERTVMLDGS
jgi:hypothetical protein